ncbi:MAG: helicase C-terminal domain-containing protein [Longimicrobiales bacterium]
MSVSFELTSDAAASIRAEILRSHGNEVCFAAACDEHGLITSPRVVARGHRSAVLAAAKGLPAGSILLHNHPSGDLTPSDADLAVAAQLYSNGIGLAIIDNDAVEIYVVVSPIKEDELQLLDEGEIDALLGPGGPISVAHPAYEDRPTQRDMARAVARIYNDGGIGIAEAGTGTGKSVAYLLPAIRWSVLNRERTVISTNTINLQEQLVTKDLPFLRRALGEPFRFALVKGRNNYISIRRARLAAQTSDTLFDNSQSTEVNALLSWIGSTRDGSLQDLPFSPTPEVWDEVVSDSDVCLRAKCPHFESCFYQRARRDAMSADILVVNHHLLFSDIAVRRTSQNYTAAAVLPPYRRLVLDEAHNLEDAATAHLGASVTRRGVLRVLARLERRGKGLLPALEGRLRTGADDLLRADALNTVSTVLRPRADRGRELAADLFHRLEQLTLRTDDGVVLLQEGFTGDAEWSEDIAPQIDGLVLVLEELARGLAKVREIVNTDRKWSDAMTEQLVEMSGAESRLRGNAAALRIAFTPGKDPYPLVRWIERRGGDASRSNIAVNAAPIDLANVMREALFDPLSSTVLTSATLATRDGFSFLRRRLGIGAGLRVSESVHPSPFDFASQTAVMLPTDLPEPRAANDHAFDASVARVTEDLARVTDGGLFVLFTSYRSLRAVAAELRRRGAETRWPLYIQGDAPRTQLLNQFTASGRGILLGVASFWEGVDVPGDPLRGLIIVKLPFKVPTEPLTAARLEAIDGNGGNSFREFMLPHAALRLKQGFGRLIRTRTDRGACIILDRRVLDKSYGKYFLDSLPPSPVRKGTWEDLLGELRTFYAEPALVVAD